jgi:hypothetical protein
VYFTAYSSFPENLTNLGPSSVASSTSADLVDSVLSAGTKSGYSFSYTAGGSTPYQTYTITALPLVVGQTGQRAFFTNQSGVIRADTSGSNATASSTPIGQ